MFLEELSSGAPVPGGSGASATRGCDVSGSRLNGGESYDREKYAQYQDEIDTVLAKTAKLTEEFKALVEKDAKVFEPLAEAYGIPKDEPGREDTEACLKTAAGAPYEMVCKAAEVSLIIERLAVIGSRLAISDVGVAATMCIAAAEGAAMNVYINTKLMKDTGYALGLNKDTESAVEEVEPAAVKHTGQ